MASAKAVLTELTSVDFLSEVADKADFLKRQLEERLAIKPSVKAIRNLGLMVGIQLNDGNQLQQVLSEARAQGLLVLSAGKDVVRLLPPLVMTKAQLADGVAILEEVL